MNTETPYKVKLSIFEGPLDLLLHLIKEQEINIYDIPILKITEQYIGYIDLMSELNLDIAGEFLVMAATLTQIKSRMLLPKPEPPYTDNEDDGEDPRAELVRKLIEYKTFKEAAGFLKESELRQIEIFPRQPEKELFDDEELLRDISIFDLLGAFNSILDKIGGTKSYEVTLDEVSVTEKLNFIMTALSRVPHIHFEELFNIAVNRLEMVATFLGLLELIRIKLVKIQQPKRLGPIIIYKAVEDKDNGVINSEINN